MDGKELKSAIIKFNVRNKMENKLYETTVVIDGNLDDEAVKAVMEKVKSILISLGSDVKSLLEPGRKKLAYKIGKSTIGYYAHIEFTAPATAIAELERQYRLNEQIIRYLTIVLDKPLLEIRERVAKYGTAQAPSASQSEAEKARLGT